MEKLTGIHNEVLEEQSRVTRRLNYIEQAFSAYRAKDYKQCILLLRGVELDDIESVSILVDAAYDFWVSVQEDSAHGEHRSGWKEKTNDQLEAVATVKSAFTQFFGSANKEDINAFQYVRLSNVYLTEAAMMGALKILHLGQARGHLENILLVIQSYTIMKTMKNKAKEVELCYEYLATAIQIEDRDNMMAVDETRRHANIYAEPGTIMIQNSDLPLYFVYLHVSCYVHRKSMNMMLDEKTRRKERELCYNLLAESYTIHFDTHPNSTKELMAWFQSFELFLDMGKYLESTAFPLLAEESYWEAYIRRPLLDISLKFCVSFMTKNKRGTKENLYALMERAYYVNPWNMLVRTHLEDHELNESILDERYYTKYTKRFAMENQKCSRIQGAMRGYLLRNIHWAQIYYTAKEKKDQWQAKVDVASTAHKKIRLMLHLDRFMRWRRYSSELHELRRHSGTLIQTCWRRVYGGIVARRKRARALRANSMFLVMSMNHYMFTRMRAIRQWENIYRKSIMDKSADCISRTLLANGFSVIFREACDKIMAGIKVKRKYSNKKIFQEWRVRFLVREKRHARATIRFWIRGQFERIRLEKERAEMERKEKIIAYLQEKSTAYIMPLYRQMWDTWRYELYLVRAAKARRKICFWCIRMCARAKARVVLWKRRQAKERDKAFYQASLFKRVGLYLLTWRRARAILPLQRSVRMFVARCKRRRWKKIRAGMLVMRLRRERAAKDRHVWCWKKFLFLRRREYHRMARRITIAFLRWLRIRHVRRASKRKPLAYNLLIKSHLMILRNAFKKMSSGVTGLHSLLVIGPLFLNRWRQCVRLGFWRWKRQLVQQKRLDGLMDLLIRKRIEKKYWKGCHEAVTIYRKYVTGAKDQMGPIEMAKTSYLMSWESAIQPPDNNVFILNDTSTFYKRKAFQTLITTYRYKHRLIRNHSTTGVIVESLVRKQFLHFFATTRGARMIQKHWRMYVDGIELRRRKLRAERTDEVYSLLENRPVYKSIQYIKYICAKRQYARSVIQGAWRQALARRAVLRKMGYYERLRGYVDQLNKKSQSARTILSKYVARWQTLYVYSMVGMHNSGMTTSLDVLRNRQQRYEYEECQMMALRKREIKKNATKERIKDRNKGVNPVPGSVVGIGPKRFGGRYGSHKQNSTSMRLSSTEMPTSINRSLSKSVNASRLLDFQSSEYSGASVERKNANIAEFSDTLLSRDSFGSVDNIYEIEEALLHDSEGNPLPPSMLTNILPAHFKNMTQKASLAFHSHMFRLQQSGIFVYDITDNDLDALETAFIMQSCLVVFVQNCNSYALKSVFNYFRGNKIVLTGGMFNRMDAIYLCSYVNNRRNSISLHFSDIDIDYAASLVLAQCMGEPTTNSGMMMNLLCNGVKVVPPALNCFALVREFSIDTDSIGALPMAQIISQMRSNTSVENLVIKISHKSALLDCYGKCFRLLSSNHYLREIRVFGAFLGRKEVQGLYDAVYHGLRGLSLLEFSCSDEAMPIANTIVELAKDRLYAGRSGLSVAVL